jgi:hypothetical protein
MKFISIIGLLISGNTFCQNVTMTQDSEPIVGQILYMYNCAPGTDPLEEINGSGAYWDYTQLVATVGMNIVDITDPSFTPYSNIFTTSTKGYEIQGKMLNCFNSTPTERMSQGFIYQDTIIGTLIAHFNTDEQKMITYPFAFGDSFSDNFSGNLSFAYNGALQNPSFTGVSYSSIDGIGSLQLPITTSFATSTLFPDVIRHKFIDTLFTQITSPTPIDLIIVRKQYDYYELSYNNMPLFSYTHFAIEEAGSGIPLTTQNIVLSQVQPNLTASLNDLKSAATSVYPNPSQGIITLKGSFNSNSVAYINDMQGKTLKVCNSIFTGQQIDLTDLQRGSYFITIETDGKRTTQKLILN